MYNCGERIQRVGLRQGPAGAKTRIGHFLCTNQRRVELNTFETFSRSWVSPHVCCNLRVCTNNPLRFSLIIDCCWDRVRTASHVDPVLAFGVDLVCRVCPDAGAVEYVPCQAATIAVSACLHGSVGSAECVYWSCAE